MQHPRNSADESEPLRRSPGDSAGGAEPRAQAELVLDAAGLGKRALEPGSARVLVIQAPERTDGYRSVGPSSPLQGQRNCCCLFCGWADAMAAQSMLRAVGLILAWYFFSMGLSLYNKFLIGEKHGHFPAPLLMTTFHFMLQYFLSTFLLNCVCTSWQPTARLSCRDYNLRIVPTAMATAIDIGLSNLSLAFITLTFYTMCKSSAPVFLLLFAFVFRLEALSFRLLGVMCVISVGVLFTVAGETEFQVLGFVLVMASSVTSGLRWVLIQVLLQKDKLGLTNPLVTLAYLTPVMALLCAIFSLLHEPWHLLHKTPFFDTWQHAIHSTLIMVLGGLLAFFMCDRSLLRSLVAISPTSIFASWALGLCRSLLLLRAQIMAEFLLVLETSAVTFSVAGTVKEGATILVSHLVFGDRFTRINVIGIFVILIGVSLFNMYRFSRSKEARHVVLTNVGEEGGGGSEDKQQLLSPQHSGGEREQTNPPGSAQTTRMRGLASPGEQSITTISTPRGPGTASEHDHPHVVVATAVESSQNVTPSPRVQCPPSASLRGVELVQRQNGQV